MAIIYTYPNLPLSNLSADDLLVITNVDATNNNPTRSVTLADIATYVTGTGSGTGTTNKIVKFTDGPNGLLGDSIMTENIDKIYVDGQLRIGSSSGTSKIQIFHGPLDSTTSFSSGGATASQILGRNNELYIENRGASRGDIIFKANNGENNGSADTYFLLDASMADIGNSSRYTRWPDHSRIVLGNSSNVNSLNFEMYYDSGTSFYNDQSTFGMYSKGGFIIENESGGSGNIEIIQSVVDADIEIKGSNGNYFKADTSAGATIFSLPVEVPLIPAADANAASKQYVDQQISSVVSGLVFQSTWDARTQAQGGLAGDAGNPDLSAADKKVVGHYYVVSVAGSATPNGAGTLPNSWNVGDWCIYVEQGATDRWEKLDQTFVSGLGVSGQVTYWNSQNEVAGDNNFFWDNANKRLGIGTTTPLAKLQVSTASSGVAAVDTGTTAVLESDTTNYLRFTSPDAALAGLVWTSPSDNFGAFLRWSHTSQLLEMGTANSNDNISFSTGNASPAMYINSSGNVGIGTDTPDAPLHVLKAAGGANIVTGLKLDPDDATANSGISIDFNASSTNTGSTLVGSRIVGAREGNNASGFLALYTSPDASGSVPLERMRIDSAGDISIFPRATAASSGSGILYFKNVDDNSATINGGSIRTVDSDSNPSGADMRFQTASDNGTLFDVFTINSNGFVGIGTIAPDFLLDVDGVARIKSASTNSQDILVLKNQINTINEYLGITFTTGVGGNGPHGAIRVYNGPSSGDVYMSLLTTSTGGTSLTQGLTQNHLGYIGIGTTAPTAPLYIVGNTDDNTNFIVIQDNDPTTNSHRPSIRFRSDLAQIGQIASLDGGMRFSVGATETSFLEIKSSGNVGIGTTSPVSLLHVAADVSSANTGTITIEGRPTGFLGDDIATIDFQNNGSKLADIRMERGNAANDSQLVFSTSDTGTLNDALIINEAGDVGIGTTNPIARLQIADDFSSSPQPLIFLYNSGSNTPGGGSEIIFGTSVSATASLYNAKIQAIRSSLDNGSSDLFFQTTHVATATSPSTKMTIKSDGNVGIGTTSPGALLHLSSTSPSIYLEDTDATNTYNITRISNAGGILSFDTRRSSDGAFVSTDYQIVKDAAGADYHRWFTQGTEKMRVNSSGDILFGTTSETNSHAYFSAESNSRMVLSLGADTTSASTIASFKNSNGAVGSISVSGSATAFNTSSDYRLKKDLKDFDGLDKVSKIPVYDFKWKVDDSSSYGVMAHELQNVLPDAVSGEKDGEEMQGVDYSKIVPLLIKSIQELEAKVKILENK